MVKSNRPLYRPDWLCSGWFWIRFSKQLVGYYQSPIWWIRRFCIRIQIDSDLRINLDNSIRFLFRLLFFFAVSFGVLRRMLCALKNGLLFYQEKSSWIYQEAQVREWNWNTERGKQLNRIFKTTTMIAPFTSKLNHSHLFKTYISKTIIIFHIKQYYTTYT